jgi:hypothetical protein
MGLPGRRCWRPSWTGGTGPQTRTEPPETEDGGRGQFLTSLLGANFDPRGEVVPQGLILSPGGKILCSPLHSCKQ